jgi:hypothetical protein
LRAGQHRRPILQEVARSGTHARTAVSQSAWHIVSFRCDAGFGRYRSHSRLDQAGPIKLDLQNAGMTAEYAQLI